MFCTPPSNPEDQLRRCLDELAGPDDGLLVAVSGGNDSIALLAAASGCGRPLVAAHVHHGQRAAADRDADAVTSICAELGVRCHVLQAPPAGARDRTETAARRRRLAALSGLALKLGLRWISTAHHLDDTLETALLNLRRGHRGARAMAGIPTVRPATTPASWDSPRYVRPFLFGAAPSGRPELQRWRIAKGLPCVHDETNDDESIPRNALRATLSANRAPLTRSRLIALRGLALAALQQQVGQAAAALSEHLRPEGLGARLGREAMAPTVAFGQKLEILRLLGGCLEQPRRLTLRGTVLESVDAGLRRGSGRLLLPATPEPLAVECRPDGLHLPDSALTPGDPAGRVASALWSTPLFL